MKRAEAVGNVLLKESDTGLARTSVALVCQIMTVDKEFLTELASSLGRRVMERVDAGLSLALDL